MTFVGIAAARKPLLSDILLTPPELNGPGYLESKFSRAMIRGFFLLCPLIWGIRVLGEIGFAGKNIFFYIEARQTGSRNY